MAAEPGAWNSRPARAALTDSTSYRITPKQIAEIVVATAQRHLVLDALSVRAVAAAYQRRGDGTDHLFGVGDTP